VPVTLHISGNPSVSKRWRLSIVVRGLPAAADMGPFTLGYGWNVAATEPTTQEDLIGGRTAAPLAQVTFDGVKTLLREGVGDARVSWQQIVSPGDSPALAVGQYLWAFVQEDADVDTPFLALGGPLRVRY